MLTSAAAHVQGGFIEDFDVPQWLGGQMNIEGFDLARLLKPVNPEDFFAEYWERKPLHIQRRDQDYYGNLLSQQDLENIISSTDMRYPAIKLVPKGSNAFYRPETYTTNFRHGNDVFNGVADIDKVFAEYRAGATVALPGNPLGRCAGVWRVLSIMPCVPTFILPQATATGSHPITTLMRSSCCNWPERSTGASTTNRSHCRS